MGLCIVLLFYKILSFLNFFRSNVRLSLLYWDSKVVFQVALRWRTCKNYDLHFLCDFNRMHGSTFLKVFLFFVNPLIAKSMVPLCLCVLPYLAIHIYCNDSEYIIFVMKIILVICRYFSKRINWLSFKAFVRYFLSNLYFSPNGSPSKTTKNVFYFI